MSQSGFGIDIFVEPEKFKITPRQLAQMPGVTKQDIEALHTQILLEMGEAIKRQTQELMQSGRITPTIGAATGWLRASLGFGYGAAYESGSLAASIHVQQEGQAIMVGVPFEWGGSGGANRSSRVSLGTLGYLLHSNRSIYVSKGMARYFKFLATARLLPPSFFRIRPGKVLKISARPFLDQGVQAFLSDKTNVQFFAKRLGYGVINMLKRSVKGLKPRTVRYGRGMVSYPVRL